MGSFVERARFLEEEIGDGKLKMGAIVGQPYAADVHVDFQDKHPRGGMAGYLEIPFAARREEMVQKLADNAVTPEGTRLIDAAIEVASEFDDMVRTNAPTKWGILKESTSYYVEDDGVEIFWHEQTMPRQTHKE